MDFAQRLDALMKEREMSKYKLSKLMHCSQSSVANWLSGDVTPQDRTLDQLSSVFGVTVGYLRGKEGKKTPDLKSEIGINPEYYELNSKNRAVIDRMIAELLKSQSQD